LPQTPKLWNAFSAKRGLLQRWTIRIILDARTDLFSFGAGPYEMATSHLAFYGTTMAVIHDAILNRAPDSYQTQCRPASKLEEIINKALEKDRDLRYHSAGDLRADQKRLKRDKSSGRSVVAALSEPVSTLEQGSAGTGTTQAIPPSRRLPLWLAGSVRMASMVPSLLWARSLFSLHCGRTADLETVRMPRV
jgi:serine/threonine protein kinase